MTGAKILNVDDREVNRYIRTQILQGAGFHVVEAATGEQALEMLQTEQPHLVLLDVNLPDLSGSEVCHQIKSFPAKVTVVVLQISSIAIDNEQRVSALEGGADGYLTEPVSPDLLIAQVRSLLRLRQAEERLRDSEQRYRTLTEALPQLVWTATRDGSCDFLSKQWSIYTGIALDVHVDLQWTMALHPDDAGGTREAWNQSVANTQTYDVEFRLRHHAGDYRWFKTRAVPMKNSTGEVSKWFGTCTDIDDQKRIEWERLEALDRERTTKEALARSNEELQHFAYAASHDLQEPLRTTILYSQLLVRKFQSQLAPEAQEYIDIIVGSSMRMQRLLQDLLAYMQTGFKQGAPSASVDTEQVLEITMSHLGASIAESGATITHEPLPTVRGDVPQLTQVFQNLIGNAIKYRGPEPLKISVSAERRDGEWMFAVRDNGRGFEAKYAEQIFGVFKRLHGQDVAGSGIGLALCRRIIERHEGRIWAESMLNEGTTFYFTLPENRIARRELSA